MVKKTRMVKKFRPKPRAARQAPPPRQMQFNQQAELQIPQHMGAMAPNMTAMAPQAASELSGPGPYKGTDGGTLINEMGGSLYAHCIPKPLNFDGFWPKKNGNFRR